MYLVISGYQSNLLLNYLLFSYNSLLNHLLHKMGCKVVGTVMLKNNRPSFSYTSKDRRTSIII